MPNGDASERPELEETEQSRVAESVSGTANVRALENRLDEVDVIKAKVSTLKDDVSSLERSTNKAVNFIIVLTFSVVLFVGWSYLETITDQVRFNADKHAHLLVQLADLEKDLREEKGVLSVALERIRTLEREKPLTRILPLPSH